MHAQARPWGRAAAAPAPTPHPSPPHPPATFAGTRSRPCPAGRPSPTARSPASPGAATTPAQSAGAALPTLRVRPAMVVVAVAVVGGGVCASCCLQLVPHTLQGAGGQACVWAACDSTCRRNVHPSTPDDAHRLRKPCVKTAFPPWPACCCTGRDELGDPGRPQQIMCHLMQMACSCVCLHVKPLLAGTPPPGRYELSDPKQTFCVTCGHYDAQLRHRWSRRQAAAPVADGGSAPQP